MPDDLKTYGKEKASDFGIHFLTVFFDTALIFVWMLGEFLFEHFFVPRFKVDSPVSLVTLWVFRVLFAMSTLIPAASKVLKHISISWARDRAAVRDAKTEIAQQAGEKSR